MFDDYEHIQNFNGGGDGSEKVAGYDHFGVIFHKRGPALLTSATKRTI